MRTWCIVCWTQPSKTEGSVTQNITQNRPIGAVCLRRGRNVHRYYITFLPHSTRSASGTDPAQSMILSHISNLRCLPHPAGHSRRERNPILTCFERIPEFVKRRFTGFTEFVNHRQLDVLITGMRFTQHSRFWWCRRRGLRLRFIFLFARPQASQRQ